MKAHKDTLIGLEMFPKSWTDKVTGTTYPRLFLEGLSREEAEGLGWYDVIETFPTKNKDQHFEGTSLKFTGSSITLEYVAVDSYSDKQKVEIARGELESATVEIASGLVFDADETSQNRMTRAILSSNAGDTTSWILADNSVATVSHEELKEALYLAGVNQTNIWLNG